MQGSTLSDITNTAASRGASLDKARPPKQPQVSLQPLAANPSKPLAACRDTGARGCLSEELGSPTEQSVQEYAPDILNKLFREEAVLLPRPDYMDSQTDISPKMRSILIDWLVEVHMKYRLCSETLHLTVNLIDRYLAKVPVMRKRLQLVGVVAMLIASKFEDVRPPELHEMVYITDSAYKKEDLLMMECTMLTSLDFKIVVPTAAHFFEILQKINCCDTTHRTLAQYLLELGLLDLRVLQHTPSHMVAAALLVSNELLKRRPVWPASMVQQSRNTELSLRACADDIRQLFEADRAGVAGQLQGVNKKFSNEQHQAVAKMKF